MLPDDDFRDNTQHYDRNDGIITQTEDELYEHHRFIADKGQTIMRIDKFLTDRLAKISRSRVQRAIEAGAVLVDDKPVKPNFKIKPLQRISIVFPEAPSEGGKFTGCQQRTADTAG